MMTELALEERIAELDRAVAGLVAAIAEQEAALPAIVERRERARDAVRAATDAWIAARRRPQDDAGTAIPVGADGVILRRPPADAGEQRRAEERQALLEEAERGRVAAEADYQAAVVPASHAERALAENRHRRDILAGQRDAATAQLAARRERDAARERTWLRRAAARVGVET